MLERKLDIDQITIIGRKPQHCGVPMDDDYDMWLCPKCNRYVINMELRIALEAQR